MFTLAGSLLEGNRRNRATLCIHLHANVSCFHGEHKPSAPSYPFIANERNSPDRDFSLSLMVKVKYITTMPNLYVILENDFRTCHLLILEAYSESSDDEDDVEDSGSQSGNKVTTDNDVDRVSESSCMHNNDLLYDNNQNNIMPDKDKVLSEDPFNLYDILNRRKDSSDDLKYPCGFTPSVINLEEVNKNIKGATRNEVNEHVNSTSNKLEYFVPKGKLLSNNSVCSKRVHTGGSILQLMDELVKKSSYKAKISIQSKLSDIDKILDQYGSNEEILSDRSLLLKELNDINSIDSLEAAQISKVCWAIEVDENTKFFDA
ncbi:hypothetical protein Tco_1235728 [Tanacetum coccineum]